MATLDDLQTNLITATNAMTALTNTVANQIGSINTTVNAKITELNDWKTTFTSNWSIDSGTVLEVGAGKQFTNLTSAWDYVKNKVITGPITIKIPDGTLTVTDQITFSNCPFAAYVSIIGNVTNPANVVLEHKLTSATDKSMFLIDNTSLVISGVTLKGNLTLTAQNKGVSYSAFRLTEAALYCAANSIIIKDCMYGIHIQNNSVFVGDGLVMTNVLRGAFVQNISSFSSSRANITLNQTPGNWVHPLSGNDWGKFGISISDNSMASLNDLKITGCDQFYGVQAYTNSYVYGSNMIISKFAQGLLSIHRSYLSTPNVSISNCNYGVQVIYNSGANLTSPMVTNSQTAYTVGHASYLYSDKLSCSNCVDGIYIHTMSSIITSKADTYLNVTGTKTNLPYNTVGNSNSYIANQA